MFKQRCAVLPRGCATETALQLLFDSDTVSLPRSLSRPKTRNLGLGLGHKQLGLGLCFELCDPVPRDVASILTPRSRGRLEAQ